MALNGTPAREFVEILEKLWWPLDKALDKEAVYYSAMVCIIDAIRHGATTLFDHHASPSIIPGSLDIIAKAVEESGIRASLCYEVSDRNGLDQAKEGIRENVRFIQRVREEKPANGRLAATFGLHASITLSDATLEQCREAIPEDVGFHIHVAEGMADQYDSLDKYGKRVVDRLYQHQILNPKTILAHAVHVDAREMELIAESGCRVSHQPRSNMNNAVGIGDIPSMLRLGIPVCLGNDGFSNTMWDEWKVAYLVHKLVKADPQAMGGYDIQQIAIYNNAKLASEQFGTEPIGMLEPGAQADLIFVDYHPFTPIDAGNLPWHIVFGFNESMITATMVAGKFLMIDRKLLTVDEEKTSAEAMKIAPRVWEKYNQQF
jgi:putative selenium metabolism protein SsnA